MGLWRDQPAHLYFGRHGRVGFETFGMRLRSLHFLLLPERCGRVSPLMKTPAILLLGLFACTACAQNATRNVVLVTLDGLRWQEVFRGADEAFINLEAGGVPEKEVAATRESWLVSTLEERRRKLMPFLWTEITSRGQLFGNRDRGSVMRVANAEWFSYPGYTELLCGFPDPLVVSNAPIPNRNVTVLEWLNGRPGFTGRVAACTTWTIFPAIINVGRSRLPLWVSGQANPSLARRSARFAEIDRWMVDIPIKSRDEHYDGFGFRAALEVIEHLRPRVLYVALGEPDTNAHRRRYDAYLDSIQRCDRFVREIWEKLQSIDQYRGSTTLLITTDHGRGRTPKDWPNHNKNTPGAEETWLAVLGPDTPARGERTDASAIVSAQVAATVASLLGEDLRAAEPRAAAPVEDVLRRPDR
jgi:hypothetical protein